MSENYKIKNSLDFPIWVGVGGLIVGLEAWAAAEKFSNNDPWAWLNVTLAVIWVGMTVLYILLTRANHYRAVADYVFDAPVLNSAGSTNSERVGELRNIIEGSKLFPGKRNGAKVPTELEEAE